ncbi:hypothetical protein B0J13DRAFT_549693 [Dactylonectria estremocensis]|uniref:Uncharacterized protein n=1 Tax=Dactylonectria estremocensis TaxID=1079267 RepID=A0A9P9J4Z6_9HYPO|nr:hypothetical protein B0J13DRAFT_549693 [Dactylonectria estremocensis]
MMEKRAFREPAHLQVAVALMTAIAAPISLASLEPANPPLAVAISTAIVAPISLVSPEPANPQVVVAPSMTTVPLEKHAYLGLVNHQHQPVLLTAIVAQMKHVKTVLVSPLLVVAIARSTLTALLMRLAFQELVNLPVAVPSMVTAAQTRPVSLEPASPQLSADAPLILTVAPGKFVSQEFVSYLVAARSILIAAVLRHAFLVYVHPRAHLIRIAPVGSLATLTAFV